MLQALRNHKDKVRISNLLLSIKFKRSLQLKVIKNVKQILSLKKFFSYAFLIYALHHQAKYRLSVLAKLNVEFFTIKFWQKLRQDRHSPIGSLYKFNSLALNLLPRPFANNHFSKIPNFEIYPLCNCPTFSSIADFLHYRRLLI